MSSRKALPPKRCVTTQKKRLEWLTVSVIFCDRDFKSLICQIKCSVSENGEKGSVNAKENGRLAAELFYKAECTIPNAAPFTWFFVRPPWAPSGVCCKSCVFNSMVELCSDAEVSFPHQMPSSIISCGGRGKEPNILPQLVDRLVNSMFYSSSVHLWWRGK